MGALRLLRFVSVEPVMFLFMVALYYQIPALNSLYLYKVCRTYYNYDKALCDDLVAAKVEANATAETRVSAESGRWMFYQTIMFVIPSGLVSLLLGVYFDKKGKFLPLLMPIIGQMLGSVYYLLMAKFDTLHIKYMLLGPVITGSFGGFATIVMATYSLVTISASDKYRMVRITLIDGSMAIGNTIGSLTSGAILNHSIDPVNGWVNAFTAILVIDAVMLVYVLVRFRNLYRRPSGSQYENMDDSGRDSSSEDSSCISVFKSINVVDTMRAVCANFPSLLQLTLLAMMTIWVTGLGKFDVLYTFSQKMGLNISYYGYYTGLDNLVQAIASVFGSYVLKRVYSWKDSSLAILGMSSAILCLSSLGISGFMPIHSTAFQVFWWMSPVLGMFQMIGPTSLRSIASGFVAQVDQGKLFSFISSIDCALQLLTSGIYQYGLWPTTVDTMPGLSFFISAGLTCISVAVVCIIKLKTQSQQPLVRDAEPA